MSARVKAFVVLFCVGAVMCVVGAYGLALATAHTRGFNVFIATEIVGGCSMFLGLMGATFPE